MKTCTKCGGEPKPRTEFYKDAQKRDGLTSRCKSCMKPAHAAYNAANPEKCKAYHAKWCAANPEKIKAHSVAYYVENREKIRAYGAANRADNPEKYKAASAGWRAANPEKYRAAVAAWKKSNPEASRILNHNYRGRKHESGGKLSKGLSAKLLKLQRGKCACGCKQSLGDNYHLDHRMPLALGGSNTDDNIQLLRSTCNQQKHAKHPVDFMQQKGFLL